MNLAESTVVDSRYEILSRIDEGGMGEIYKAREIELDRIVALKLLHSTLVSDEEARVRFAREADVCRRLSHPHIGTFYRLGFWQEKYPYIAMEFLDGESLRKTLNRLERLPWREAVAIAAQIADAMDYAHAQGILHRDLKPTNVILQTQPSPNFVKLLDFGLARIVGENERQKLTQTGALIGSIYYMSPEQCRGSSFDHRSDIYALGCVLFELITGQPPFSADNPIGMLHLHANEEAPRLSTFTKLNCPPALDAVLALAMAKLPSERYQSMAVLMQDLTALLHDEVPGAVSRGSSSHAPLSSKEGNKHILAVTGLVVLVLFAASLVLDPGIGVPLALLEDRLPSSAVPGFIKIADSFKKFGKVKAADAIYHSAYLKSKDSEPTSLITAELSLFEAERLLATGQAVAARRVLLEGLHAFEVQRSIWGNLSGDRRKAFCLLVKTTADERFCDKSFLPVLSKLAEVPDDELTKNVLAESGLSVAMKYEPANLFVYELAVAELTASTNPARARYLTESALKRLKTSAEKLKALDEIVWRIRISHALAKMGDKQAVLQQIGELENMIGKCDEKVAKKAELYRQLGELSLAVDDRPRAFELYEKSYGKGSRKNDDAAVQRLASLYRDFYKDNVKAEALLRKHFATIDKPSAPLGELYGELLILNGKIDEAIAVADLHVRQKSPDSWAQLQVWAGKRYAQQHNYAAVAKIANAERWRINFKDHPKALVQYALLLHYARKYEDSVSKSKMALRQDLDQSRRLTVLVNLMESLNALKRTDESLAVLRENRAELVKNRSFVISNLAAAMRQEGKTQDALNVVREFYKEVSDLQRIEFSINLAVATTDVNDRERQVAYLKSMETKDKAPAVQYAAARALAVYASFFRLPDMYDRFQRCLQLRKSVGASGLDQVDLLLTAGTFELNRGNEAVALPLLSECVRVAEQIANHRSAHLARLRPAWLCLEKGDFEKARKILNETQGFLGDNGSVRERFEWNILAQRLACAEGQLDKADAYGEAARELVDNSSDDILYAVGAVEVALLRGKTDLAERIAEEFFSNLSERLRNSLHGQAIYYRQKGLIAVARGRKDAAREYFGKSLTGLRRVLAPADLRLKRAEQRAAGDNALEPWLKAHWPYH